jgi:hypothetical protein
MLMSIGMPYVTPWAGLGAAARTTTIGVDTAEAGVANRMVGPGTFTSEDIALGVHEICKLSREVQNRLLFSFTPRLVERYH